MPSTTISFDDYLHNAPPTIVFQPDFPTFTIITANEAYLEATNSRLDDLVGIGVFDAFPENPATPEGKHVEALRNSLMQALTTKQRVILPVQRYDIPIRGTDKFETRYWRATNSPVLNKQGDVEYIVHVSLDVSTVFELAKKERIAYEVAEAQRQQLNASFQQAPVAIGLLKGHALIVETANDMLLALWGKTQEVIGLPLIEALPELENQPFPGLLKEVYTTGKAYHGTETLAHLEHDGQLEPLYFNFTYQPVVDDEGITTSVMIVATNVTEQVETRRRVEESELRLRNLVTTVHYALLILRGLNWIIEIANQSLADLWSKSLPDIIGKPLMEVLPELEGQPFPALLKQVYDSGKGYGQEEEVFYHDSPQGRQKKYVSFYYDPLFDSSHEVTGIIVSAEDITERVTDRMARDRAQEMLRLAVQSANLGTWYINAETREFIPSVRLKELFGFGPNETMTYETAIAHISDDYRSFVIDAIEAAITKGEAYDIEYPIYTHNDHKLCWVRATGKLYPANDNTSAYFSGTLLDITAQKMDEQRKNDFVAMVSHELKTPLTSAKAYVQMLNAKSRKTQDHFSANALDKVELQVNRMQTLIKGFLDIARLEAGKIYLNIQAFKLNDLLQEAVDEALLLSHSHRITFTPCEDVIIKADRDKIAQVVNNFLSNAVKYSPKGRYIEVSCKHTGTEAQVSVKDEGMGIKPQDIDKLFTRFYRVESKHTQTISGFGIGLYLCSEIIQRHNGRIWVESEVGIGSTFHFSLPIQSPEEHN